MMHFRPEMLDKFTPVIAKDIDSENILLAKKPRIQVQNGDIERINYLTGFHLNDYFNSCICGNKFYLEPCDEIRKRIIYKQGDVFDDVKSMPENNSILHVRNFWKYLSEIRRELLMSEISDRMQDETSTLVLGNYDLDSQMYSLLDKYGFIEDINVYNVYSKKLDFGKFSKFLY